jgi:hypothetical protein
MWSHSTTVVSGRIIKTVIIIWTNVQHAIAQGTLLQSKVKQCTIIKVAKLRVFTFQIHIRDNGRFEIIKYVSCFILSDGVRSV